MSTNAKIFIGAIILILYACTSKRNISLSYSTANIKENFAGKYYLHDSSYLDPDVFFDFNTNGTLINQSTQDFKDSKHQLKIKGTYELDNKEQEVYIYLDFMGGINDTLKYISEGVIGWHDEMYLKKKENINFKNDKVVQENIEVNSEEKKQEITDNTPQNIEQSKTSENTTESTNTTEPKDNEFNIGNVTIEGNTVYIYNQKDNSYNHFFCVSGTIICGFNSKYLVIRGGNGTSRYAEIYNAHGWSIADFDASAGEITKVTPSAIILQFGRNTEYYNFHGNLISSTQN